MLQDLLVLHLSVAEKIVRTVLVYALIVVLIRLTGKRGLTGMSTLDLVVTFLLSNVVQNAIIGPDNTLLGGAIGAVTLVAVNAAVNRLTASSASVARVLERTPTTLITDGTVDRAAARRLGIRTATSSTRYGCRAATASTRSRSGFAGTQRSARDHAQGRRPGDDPQ